MQATQVPPEDTEKHRWQERLDKSMKYIQHNQKELLLREISNEKKFSCNDIYFLTCTLGHVCKICPVFNLKKMAGLFHLNK